MSACELHVSHETKGIRERGMLFVKVYWVGACHMG